MAGMRSRAGTALRSLANWLSPEELEREVRDLIDTHRELLAARRDDVPPPGPPYPDAEVRAARALLAARGAPATRELLRWAMADFYCWMEARTLDSFSRIVDEVAAVRAGVDVPVGRWAW